MKCAEKILSEREIFMTKIIVYVSGGCVQDVVSNREEVEVMVVDYDNEETNGEQKREFESVRCDPIHFERTVAGIED